MEELVRAGFIRGVLDVTTTELADELVGGALPAYPGRLEAAGLPQVVSLGALDMVNFGPRATVPERFAGRTFYVHNPTVTLMRTTAGECAQLGLRLAERLNAATGATAVFVPLRGISQIDAEGQPFHDPRADTALFRALRDGLADTVELHELDLHINDPALAPAMATRLDELIIIYNSGRYRMAVALIQAMHDAAKRVNPRILVLCHGGPIAEPEDAAYVLDHTEGIVGFYGASSMERLPTERALTDTVRRFKALPISKGER